MDYMRPAIVHGYGGAKVDLPDSLPALAKFGWATLGASLLGTCSCFPQWCKKDSGDSVRLAPGCDVSFRVAPAPLSLSEEVYLMGLWRHLTPEEAAERIDGLPSVLEMRGVQVTVTTRQSREQFVKCLFLSLKGWSSFDSKGCTRHG